MRPLKPIRILVAGSLLSGLAIAIGTAAAWPDARNARGITIAFVTGAIFGLLMFAPIAAGEALRSTFVRRHSAAFERWSAICIAMGLGHLIGSRLGTNGIFLAWGLVFVAACFRVYLSSVARRFADGPAEGPR
jgi:hypothetical protein